MQLIFPNSTRYLRGTKGFSLVELLAVVLILGIIASIALPRLDTSMEAAKQEKVQQDIATLNNAIIQWQTTYPGVSFAARVTQVSQADLSTTADTTNRLDAEKAFHLLKGFLTLRGGIDSLATYNADTADDYTYTYTTSGGSPQFVY